MTPDREPARGEVEFLTSGQSGEPVVWLRSEAQLRAEVALLARTTVGEVDRIVTYAPPQHVYGRLFGVVLPEYLGVPVDQLWQSPLTPPGLPPGRRTLLVCLPSTWVMLRGLADRIRSAGGVVAVHSTGPTTPATRQLVAALDGSGFRAVEILGSTETGGIAHRTLAPGQAGPSLWSLLDDVRLVHDGLLREQPLRVASPRLARTPDMTARPETITLDDLVRPIGDRQFELLGRATRMIKINGRRIRLDSVEAALRRSFPGVDMVCVPRRDAVRAEHYDLYFADDHGRMPVRDVYTLLAEAIPGVPLPRLLRRVPRIPRNATGKVRLDSLLASAGEPVEGDGCGV